MKTLLILNDPAHGAERSYDGLRVAGALANRDGTHVRVLLIGEAAGCWHMPGLPRIDDDHLTKGARRSRLDQLADGTIWADKVVTF